MDASIGEDEPVENKEPNYEEIEDFLRSKNYPLRMRGS